MPPICSAICALCLPLRTLGASLRRCYSPRCCARSALASDPAGQRLRRCYSCRVCARSACCEAEGRRYGAAIPSASPKTGSPPPSASQPSGVRYPSPLPLRRYLRPSDLVAMRSSPSSLGSRSRRRRGYRPPRTLSRTPYAPLPSIMRLSVRGPPRVYAYTPPRGYRPPLNFFSPVGRQ